MKKYLFFFRDGQVILGSDGCVPVDGRLGLERLKELAAEIAHRKRNVCRDINGFKIHQGSLLNETKGPLYPIKTDQQ